MDSLKKGSLPTKTFESALDQLCDTLTEEVKPFYHSDLQPFESFSDYLKEKIKKQITSFKNSFVNGYRLVLEEIVAKHPTDEKIKYNIPPDLWENLQNAEQALQEKDTLQAMIGYTDKMMAEIYALAMRYYSAGDYDKSSDLFIFLATLSPYSGWFWQGLGKSWQALQRDDDALYAYILALNCLPYEIEGYQDAARCCLKQNKYAEALNILQYGLDVVNSSEDKESLQKLQHALKAMIAYVEKLKRGEK